MKWVHKYGQYVSNLLEVVGFHTHGMFVVLSLLHEVKWHRVAFKMTTYVDRAEYNFMTPLFLTLHPLLSAVHEENRSIETTLAESVEKKGVY